MVDIFRNLIYDIIREMVVMKKVFGKEMIVLWVSLAALVCAAISLNDSLNQLAENEQGNDMD